MPPKAAPPTATEDLVARRELWPVREAAYKLGFSTQTLYRERARGNIKTVRIGQLSFVTDKELRRYVADRESEAS